MAFHLAGLFSGGSKAVSESGGSHRVSEGAQRLQTQEAVRSLQPGQTISGEIVEKNGNEVQIRIGQDMVISARLEAAMNMQIGQAMSFEVKSNAGGLLALRPLFENMSRDMGAMKALTEAGMAVTGDSLEMTSVMMKEGMSVSRDSLQQMYRQVQAFPGASVTSLVQMSRLGIPLTEENIGQFEAYKNYGHQLSGAVQEVCEQLFQALGEMITGGDKTGGAFLQQLLGIFLPTGGGSEGEQAGNAGIMESGQSPENAAGSAPTADGILPEGGGQANGGQVLTGDGQVMPEGNGEALNAQSAAGREGLVIAMEESGPDGNERVPAAVLAEGTEAAGDGRAEPAFLSAGQRGELLSAFGAAGASGEQLAALQQKGFSPEEVLRLAQRLLEQHVGGGEGAHGEGLQKLISSGGFQKALQSVITQQWTLSPEMVNEKERVTQLYNRLQAQTGQLMRALTDVGRGDSALGKSVMNIRENVDFMQQLNQMYTYVQLPLRLQGQSAHGELYVYTNKKNLAKKDGNISAFLHLDMEHLGKVDVHVRMSAGKVDTHFYLENEAMLSFLEPHLPELTERLNRRGYETTMQATVQEEEKTVMERILETDKNMGVMSQFSFDVRA